MNKKGLSEIVSTVLILLITISGIVLLSSIIVPYVNNKLSSGSECTPYNTGYFEFEDNLDGENYNCYQEIKGDLTNPSSQTNRLYGFSVKLDESGEEYFDKVESFNIILTKESSITLNINNSDKIGSLLELNETPTPTKYGLLEPGETITYRFNETFSASEGGSRQVYDKADIYPVLKSGKICGLSDSIAIKPCAPGTALT